ncbi:MAG: alpha/beta hydrolase [Myxococcota bacterium]
MSFRAQDRLIGGVRHHIVEWPAAAPEKPHPVLLAHGFLDQSYSWIGVAEALSRAGYRTFAWDFRGHGRTDWCAEGGYYHFFDYIRDVDGLAEVLSPGRSFHLVGHSMGGTVCSLFAPLRPERLESLALIEGMGPPNRAAADAFDKAKTWFASLERYERRRQRVMTLDETITRMNLKPGTQMDPERARFLAEKATRPVPGGRTWRFDPLHRTTSPTLFMAESFARFVSRLETRTLVVRGEKGFRLPDEDAREAGLANARAVELPDVGHMLHWHAPEALAAELLAHFDH